MARRLVIDMRLAGCVGPSRRRDSSYQDDLNVFGVTILTVLMTCYTNNEMQESTACSLELQTNGQYSAAHLYLVLFPPVPAYTGQAPWSRTGSAG